MIRVVFSICAAAVLSFPVAGTGEEAVVVSATRTAQRGFDAPAALNAIYGEGINEAGLGVNISDPLSRIPGVYALDRQNYAQDQQLSIRGFGSRSAFGVRGIRLLVDGFPATMPDGQGQISAIDLRGAERIEVLRGPLAQLYGNAAGGVIQTFTGIGGRDVLKSSVDFGDFDTQSYQLRLRGESGALQGAASLSRFDTDGYRDHSAARRNLFNTKLRYALSDNTSATVVANLFDQPFAQDPLGLSRAELRADRRSATPTAEEFDTRKSVRQNQGGLLIETRPNALQTLSARAYYGERDLFQALAIPLSAQLSPTSSGGIVDLDRRYGGVNLQFAQKQFLHSSLSFTTGVDIDAMRETRRGYINDAGERGELKRNEKDTVWNTDLYAQLSWRFADQWSTTAGLRHSVVRFDVEDDFITASNPDDSGDVRYRATNPVVGLTYHATETLNLYANYGRGFETPSFAELAYRTTGPGLNLGLDPAFAKHAEIGLKYWPYSGHELEIALFQVKTRDELVVDTSSGGRTTYRNADRTIRHGLELSYTGALSPTIGARVAWTELNARFDTDDASDGNRLPGAPRRQIFVLLQWKPELQGSLRGFNAAVEGIHVGRIEVNEANTDAAAANTRFNLRLGLDKRYGDWHLSTYARLNNLTDKEYVGSVIVNQQAGRFFEPAPGRNWMIGLSLDKAL